MITTAELYPASVPNEIKVIRVPAGARKQVVFQLRTREGQPVDMTREVLTAPAPAPDFQPVPAVSTMNSSVQLAARGDWGQPGLFSLLGTWDPVNRGVVVFELDESTTSQPGVYLCDVGHFVADTHLIETWPCYLMVEANAFDALAGDGPLTVAELRMGLLDFAPDEVSLLDSMEFSDNQLIHAIKRVVDIWNEAPPDVGYYSVQTFPYRHNWIVGATGILFDMAATKYRRNYLAYSAGGVSIDDKTKAQEYQQAGAARMAEFRDWMAREKMRYQIITGWGCV